MLARRGLSAALLFVCGVAAPVAAQSLGDVARQEEARRATTKKATKSFSNADLKPSEIAPPSGAPAAAGTAAAEPCDASAGKTGCAPATEQPASGSGNAANGEAAKAEPVSAEQAKAERAKQEPNWRRQATTIRDQLNKAQKELDSLSANASDQSRSPGERGASERMIAVRQSMIDGLERQWAKLEKEAEQQKVPREWLDPRPILSPRMPR